MPKAISRSPSASHRFHRRPARIPPAQVDVQLTVREALGHLVPEADGQRGLAHPGRPRDDHHRHRLVRLGGPGRRQHVVQRAELVVAAGEALRVQRQLGRDGNAGGGPRRRSTGTGAKTRAGPGQQDRPSRSAGLAGQDGPIGSARTRPGGLPSRPGRSAGRVREPVRSRAASQVQRGITGQHLLVNPGQLGPGIDAEFLGEHVPAVGEHPQRLGVPPAAVQRDHQQPAHALAQRMIRHQDGQVGHDLLVAAQREQDIGPFLGGTRAQLGEPHPLGLRERARHAGERDAAPEPERALQRVDRGRPGRRSCAVAGPGPAAARRRPRRAGPAPGAGRTRLRRRPARGPARGPTWRAR